MKQSLSIFTATVCVAATLCCGINAGYSYLKEEQEKFTRAVHIVQRSAYKAMILAQAAKDKQRIAYFRYKYENASKVVAHYGAEAIINYEKSR